MNINCTLLFGLPRYKEVIDEYIAGLEDRIKAKKPVDMVVSVASFNIDRIVQPWLMIIRMNSGLIAKR